MNKDYYHTIAKSVNSDIENICQLCKSKSAFIKNKYKSRCPETLVNRCDNTYWLPDVRVLDETKTGIYVGMKTYTGENAEADVRRYLTTDYGLPLEKDEKNKFLKYMVGQEWEKNCGAEKGKVCEYCTGYRQNNLSEFKVYSHEDHRKVHWTWKKHGTLEPYM